MESVTTFLAESAAAYTFEELPEHVGRVAQSCILDWLGVVIAAAEDPVVVAIRESLSSSDSGGSIIGTDLVAAPLDAARINGVAGHVLDYDDVLSVFTGHPTAPVLPAALAIAESKGLSGKQLLAALVAGIETEARVSQIVAPSHYAMGFHATASVGVFGSVAAVSNLLSLTVEQTTNAMGLASTSASGLKSGFGNWGKSLQVGHAASEGALAAILASKHGKGPVDGIGCEKGFAQTHSRRQDFDSARQPLGEPWHTKDVLFKYHASCYGTHSSIETLLRLREGADLAAVAEIKLGICPQHVGMCTQVNVTTPLQAKFSLAFTAALAWLKGSAAVQDFAPEVISDRAIQELAGKVVTVSDGNHGFEQTDVLVRLNDGTTLSGMADMSIAATEYQADAQWQKLAVKFHSLVDPVLGAERASNIVDAVDNLSQLDDVSQLMALTRTTATMAV